MEKSFNRNNYPITQLNIFNSHRGKKKKHKFVMNRVQIPGYNNYNICFGKKT